MTHDQLITSLELEIRRLRAETAQLRHRLGERNRHARRVQRAAEDARLLLLFRAGGCPTSLGHASQQAGMSRRRWEAAIALLRMARLLDYDWSWSLGSDADNETALSRAAGRAIANRSSFLMRLAKHGQPGGMSA